MNMDFGYVELVRQHLLTPRNMKTHDEHGIPYQQSPDVLKRRTCRMVHTKYCRTIGV